MTKSTHANASLIPEDEHYPTEQMIKHARRANRVLSTTAMVSLGMLAALITHHTLKDKEWPVGAIAIADAVSLFTAIAGKVAIMLFFSESPFLEGFKKICRKQLPDYFKLSKKSNFEKLQWTVNLLLSVNISLFWSGLVEVSFKTSGDLFKKFNTPITYAIGNQLQQWYVYLPFVLSSLYANMIGSPGAHTSAYLQKKAFLSWLWKKPWEYNHMETELREINFHVDHTHRSLLQELKRIIEGSNQSPVLNKLLNLKEENTHALIDCLLNVSDEQYLNDNAAFQQHTATKVNQLLALGTQKLRKLYIKNSEAVYVPLSKKQKFLKYGLAVSISATAAYGFRNVIGLSHAVWKNWGMESFSRYVTGYCTYYSSAEIIFLTVYPMLCNLFDAAREGITPYVFSRKKLAFIIGMVFFVGIFGGLANAEQSYLDGESMLDVLNSDIASFLMDAFSIYIIFKSSFETNVRESTAIDPKTVLKQRFLQLQAQGQQAYALSSADELKEHSSFSIPMYG